MIKQPSPILIKNGTIYLENSILKNASLLLLKGKIACILLNDEINIEDLTVIDGTDFHIIPGFIDGHIHGARGYDVMDASEEALDAIAMCLPKEGVTSFLATTITQSVENIENALVNVANFKNKPYQAELIGIHLEGPFINKKMAGAQPKRFIKQPNEELFKKWQQLSNHQIKTITMAPELDVNGKFIRYLIESGINVSAGHTDASFGEMKVAVEHGVRQLTHLCNAMNGIHHRDIGAVGAAFQLRPLRSEVIADGVHVSKEMLQIIYNNIGSDRIILITDAMRAKALGQGNYELGGQPVKVLDDKAILHDGTLAGSTLKMQEAALRMFKLDGVSIQDIVKMTSGNIAKQLGIDDRKGVIAEGKDADLVMLDSNLTIKYTICGGLISYKEN
ncbi:N-acetylglucosamine-6-phosphate deacetylase [Lysinibacillus sp. PLM2]|nr:N-acetylglucosamine-6-phosphate deacetylase [Lysinibacillus sp. PLM2]